MFKCDSVIEQLQKSEGALYLKIRPFELERWLPAHSCEYDLAGSVVKSLKLGELVDEIDLDIELMHGPTNGAEELRNGVSGLYSNVNEDNVLIVNGTTEGNFLALTYLLEPGDEVILGGIPTYLQCARLAEALGAKVKFFYLNEEENYKVNIDSLTEAVSSKTKMIIITSPNNPTGSRFSPKEIHDICEVAKGVNAYVLADEVLRYTELDGVLSLSPAEIYEKGISTGSISKLGLAGLRTGWIVADKDLIKQLWAQKDYTTLATPILSDYVSMFALQKENIKKIIKRARNICKTNLEILSKWLMENKYLKCLTPLAGAVAFPQYEFNMVSVEFCKKLLNEKSILLTPGDYFMAPKHFRIQYGGVDRETLKIVLGRINDFFDVLPET